MPILRPTLAAVLLLSGCVHVPSPDQIESLPLPDIDMRAQDSGVTASLRGVYALDESTCWASGSVGTCLRTTDAGETWQRLIIPNAEELDFRDVHPFDENNAVLMTAGTPARVYRTSDGGEHWAIVHEDHREGAFFDAMDFWDENRGVLFGDPIDGVFTILLTDDAGRSWQQLDARNIPEAMPNEAGFAASGTCVAAGPNGRAIIALGGDTGLPIARVLESDDFGLTWSARSCNIPTSASSGVFSVAFVGDDQIVAVGGDYAEPEAHTGDVAVSFQPTFTGPGTDSWSRTDLGSAMAYRSAVAVGELDGRSVLLAGGYRRCYVSSHLANAHWKPIEPIPGTGEPGSDGSDAWYQHAVSFAPGTARAWIVGAEGKITRIDLSIPDDLPRH